MEVKARTNRRKILMGILIFLIIGVIGAGAYIVWRLSISEEDVGTDKPKADTKYSKYLPLACWHSGGENGECCCDCYGEGSCGAWSENEDTPLYGLNLDNYLCGYNCQYNTDRMNQLLASGEFKAGDFALCTAPSTATDHFQKPGLIQPKSSKDLKSSTATTQKECYNICIKDNKTCNSVDYSKLNASNLCPSGYEVDTTNKGSVNDSTGEYSISCSSGQQRGKDFYDNCSGDGNNGCTNPVGCGVCCKLIETPTSPVCESLKFIEKSEAFYKITYEGEGFYCDNEKLKLFYIRGTDKTKLQSLGYLECSNTCSVVSGGNDTCTIKQSAGFNATLTGKFTGDPGSWLINSDVNGDNNLIDPPDYDKRNIGNFGISKDILVNFPYPFTNITVGRYVELQATTETTPSSACRVVFTLPSLDSKTGSCENLTPKEQYLLDTANNTIKYTANAGGTGNVSQYYWYADTNCDGDYNDTNDLNADTKTSSRVASSQKSSDLSIKFTPTTTSKDSCNVEVKVMFSDVDGLKSSTNCAAKVYLEEPGEININKTGPVCVERVSPNNIANFTVKISTGSESTTDTQSVKTVTDVLPSGLTYNTGSAKFKLNGSSITAPTPTINSSDGVQTIVWENSSGWVVNRTEGSLTITFSATATGSAITGDNTNIVNVSYADGNSDSDEYTFEVAQTCAPNTSIKDSIIIYLVPFVLLIVGIVLYRNEILITLPRIKFSTNIEDTADMLVIKYTKPKEYFEKKVERKLRNKV